MWNVLKRAASCAADGVSVSANDPGSIIARLSLSLSLSLCVCVCVSVCLSVCALPALFTCHAEWQMSYDNCATDRQVSLTRNQSGLQLFVMFYRNALCYLLQLLSNVSLAVRPCVCLSVKSTTKHHYTKPHKLCISLQRIHH